VCTVTVFRLPGDVMRVACNRDELTSRPPALSPRVVRVDGRRAVMPIDPAGGGTWVAANDACVVMALLNVNALGPHHHAGPGASGDDPDRTPSNFVRRNQVLRSRGLIIPSLLGCASTDDAVDAATCVHVADYAPFRLVLVNRESLADVVWDGRRLRVRFHAPDDRPAMFTSSGLGDHVVDPPRRALFEELLRARGPGAATQDTLHGHQWLDRPHLSVCMRRAGARTVAHTVVEVSPDGVEFRHHPAAPDEPSPDHVTRLSFGGVIAEVA
jgi:hypothetical protein